MSSEEVTGRLAGRVAIVTGAGRGLGRAHALRLAAEGAAVIVNDIGVGLDGSGADPGPAAGVVDEIAARGGRAAVSGHDVADWSQAEALIALAVAEFGSLDVLVNNAGILRDKAFANMTEADWDAVLRVNLKGHAATSHHALAYWRDRSKSGVPVAASIVHTTSGAGLGAKFGQANYAAAKLGIVALSACIAVEGARYGVRSNAVAPSAGGTRMVLGDAAEDKRDAGGPGDPANISPLVAWLADAACPANGQVYYLSGNRLLVSGLPPIHARLRSEDRWSLEQLDAVLPSHLVELHTSAAFHDPEPEHLLA